MKKALLLLTFILFSNYVFSQNVAPTVKYEYVMVIVNFNPFQARTLDIIYPDGKVETFAELAANDAGKKLNKNLSTLLNAFNYLGSQGYLLIDGHNKDSNIEAGAQHIFKREVSN